MESRRADSAMKASIYNNPFELEKDQLIRQIFEFPARVAALVQSQKQDGNSQAIESPFSILAAKLKARDELEPRQSASAEITRPNETFLAQNLLVEPSSKDAGLTKSRVEEVGGCAVDFNKVAESEPVTYIRKKRKYLDLLASSGEGLLGDGEVNPSMPLTSSSKQHDAADFIIEVIRTLRHTKNDNTEKLFELLSVPDFPVDKCRLLEDLIQQAYHYNKDIVAKQLAKYRSEILQGVSTANNEMKE